MSSSFSICACAFAVSGRKRVVAPFQAILRRNDIADSPSRQRIVGKAVAEVGQREVERVGERPRAVERLGKIGEERGHLVGTLHVPLAIDAEEPAGVVDVAPFADAREDVVQLLVLGTRIADAVRGDERQTKTPREIDEGDVAMLFVAPVMPLQLDMRASAEDAADLVQQRFGFDDAALRQRMRERPFIAAGDAVQSGRVLRDEIPREPRFALRPVERAGSEELAEIAIAVVIFDEQRKPRLARIRARRIHARELQSFDRHVVVDHDLGADDRPDSRLLRRAVKPRRAVDAIRVDERHRRNVFLRGVEDEVLGQTGAVEERKRARGAHLRVRTRCFDDVPRALSSTFLSGAC